MSAGERLADLLSLVLRRQVLKDFARKVKYHCVESVASVGYITLQSRDQHKFGFSAVPMQRVELVEVPVVVVGLPVATVDLLAIVDRVPFLEEVVLYIIAFRYFETVCDGVGEIC